jgi:hypothetical protein
MTTNSWKSAISGDWTNAADWATGVVPSATDTVTVGVQGIYTITLYAEGVAAGLILNDSGLLFYEAGTLAVSGTTTLQAGTLDLAYGTLQGGTLALAGGSFETSGGTLSGVTVQNTLNLNANDAILFVQDGLVLQGAGGTGAGSVNLTGNNASLDFIGSQSLASASLTLGAFQGGVASLGIAHGFGATSGATLTLGPSVWVKETGGNAALVIGNALGGPLTDALINQGTMTATGGNFTISGPGIFYNQGDIGASGGAVLDRQRRHDQYRPDCRQRRDPGFRGHFRHQAAVQSGIAAIVAGNRGNRRPGRECRRDPDGEPDVVAGRDFAGRHHHRRHGGR